MGNLTNYHSHSLYCDGRAGMEDFVRFTGGCAGNTQGVAALIEGMDIDEAIRRMDGIKCGYKDTSCPDQLAKALKEYKKDNE